jgi:RNA polymerase sigma-70 factor (ECF subfamily)
MVEDESQLVARARRGDSAAFGRLALRHRERVRGLLFRLLGAADVDDEEQEVFLAAWRGLGGFRGEASFATWLASIVVNRARRVLRRRREVPAALDAEHPDPGAAPPERARAAERNGRVVRAVSALPVKLRIAFVLRYVEGMSGEETARVLGIPSGTVRSRLFEARRRLAADLAEEIEE